MSKEIREITDMALYAYNHPMDCNMFEKKCTLLTCHMKRACLWTKEEVKKERGLALDSDSKQ